MSHRRARHLNPKHAGATVVLDSRFLSGFANGDPVGTWAGRGASSGTATGTARPTYQDGSSDKIGGNAVVKFDGSNDLVAIDSTGLAVFKNAASGLLLFVGVDDNVSGGATSGHTYVYFSNNITSARLGIEYVKSTSKLLTGARRIDGDSAVSVTANGSASSPFIASSLANWSGNSLVLSVNGSPGSSVAFSSGGGSTSNTNSSLARIGAYLTGTDFMPGRACQVLAISPAPSSPCIKRLNHSAAFSFKIQCN